MAAPAPAPARVKPPSFALLETPRPRRSIFVSHLVHTVLFAAIPYLGLLIPLMPSVTVQKPAEIVDQSIEEPLTFARLPALTDRGSHASAGAGSARPAAASMRPEHNTPPPVVNSAPPRLPKNIYAGGQEIVSDSPDASNIVQTIRRPDLRNAPKLKFPVIVPNMVVLPPPPLPTAPPTLQKKRIETAAPEPLAPLVATVENPSLPVPVSPLRNVELEPQAPKPVETQNVAPAASKADTKPLPVPIATDPDSTAKQAVVVVNAVTVPAAPIKIPDAEISGNFAVVTQPPVRTNDADGAGKTGTTPSSASTSSGNANSPSTALDSAASGGTSNGTTSGGLATGGSSAGTGKGAAPSNGTNPGGASGTNAGTGAGTGPGHATGIGTNTGAGSGSGPGSATGPGRGSGAGTVPGLTIVGGSPGRSGEGGSRTPSRRPTYGITIISGGTSGGASRDTGFFGRNDTVYTVYISMQGSGGGPDWPMQYALITPSAVGNVLLVPPVAEKKFPAVVPAQTQGFTPGVVFIGAIIDDNGDMQNVRSVRPTDNNAQVAIDALARWKFLPAQLDGKPVAVKVLIGVNAIAVPPANTQ